MKLCICYYVVTFFWGGGGGFPGDILAATQVDPNDPGRVIGRTEIKLIDL